MYCEYCGGEHIGGEEVCAFCGKPFFETSAGKKNETEYRVLRSDLSKSNRQSHATFDDFTRLSSKEHKRRRLRIEIVSACTAVILLCLGAAIVFRSAGNLKAALEAESRASAERYIAELAEREQATLSPTESEPAGEAYIEAEAVPAETVPVEYHSEYVFVKENVGWDVARANAESYGGHLAVINSPEEFNALPQLAEQNGIGVVWIGLHRENGSLIWERSADPGEPYYQWTDGEPTVFYDNVPEDYVFLWNSTGPWGYNDCILDPVSDHPEIYLDRIGYIVEIETEVSQ